MTEDLMRNLPGNLVNVMVGAFAENGGPYALLRQRLTWKNNVHVNKSLGIFLHCCK